MRAAGTLPNETRRRARERSGKQFADDEMELFADVEKREVEQKESINALRRSAETCKACDLWKHATQTVFGEGPKKARIMFVGEQPGDQEDRGGRPFIGPAGKLLDDALTQVGINRAEVYVTNVVKHFKWEPRGKRRIHKKPRSSEIEACRPWLDSEIRVVHPDVLVCLGATAAQALFGKTFSVTRQRGQLVDSPLARYAMATVHPSSILRAPDDEARHLEIKAFIDDLKRILPLVAQKRAA